MRPADVFEANWVVLNGNWVCVSWLPREEMCIENWDMPPSPNTPKKLSNFREKKAGCLLGTARALEHLPHLSEAFRLGKIGWGKLRAIRGLATPETERQWLEFAQNHRTDEVVRKVTLSPQAWKRHQALRASLEGEPTVTEREVSTVLKGEAKGAASSACLVSATRVQMPVAAPRPNNTPPLPAPPRTIRLVIELTPDQYALYERAESRVRAQARHRLSRAKVLTKMSEAVLSNGTARSRAKHQVLIHTEPESGRVWYDTQKGPLPVDPALLEETKVGTQPLKIGHERSELPSAPASKKPSRAVISNATLRQLFAQAGHQCQRCGTRDALFDTHHTQPVSEGGDNRLESLRVLCRSCHSLSHETDYTTKPEWRAARRAGRRRAKTSRGNSSRQQFSDMQQREFRA